jgi:hypothetical protein
VGAWNGSEAARGASARPRRREPGQQSADLLGAQRAGDGEHAVHIEQILLLRRHLWGLRFCHSIFLNYSSLEGGLISLNQLECASLLVYTFVVIALAHFLIAFCISRK